MFVTGWLCCLSRVLVVLLVADRRLVDESGVAAVAIVPVDVDHNLCAGVGLVLEAGLVERLAFDGSEDRLGHAVVESVASGSHRQHDSGSPAAAPEGDAAVLASLI